MIVKARAKRTITATTHHRRTVEEESGGDVMVAGVPAKTHRIADADEVRGLPFHDGAPVVPRPG